MKPLEANLRLISGFVGFSLPNCIKKRLAFNAAGTRALVCRLMSLRVNHNTRAGNCNVFDGYANAKNIHITPEFLLRG